MKSMLIVFLLCAAACSGQHAEEVSAGSISIGAARGGIVIPTHDGAILIPPVDGLVTVVGPDGNSIVRQPYIPVY